MKGESRVKLICQIELPDDADYKTKLDAIAQAGRDESKWKKAESKEERMKRTNLDNKCGSCEYFKLINPELSMVYGDCMKGRAEFKERTCKACKSYERKQQK